MRGERGSSGGRGSGGFDPGSLHLKKELTQIKKAARMLRDPGTTTSWRSPINSSRSAGPHNYYHRQKVDFGTHGNVEPQSQVPLIVNSTSNIVTKEKEKKAFLYNWRSQKLESERSKKYCDDGIESENHDDIEASSSSQEGEDSLSDARHCGNDSKSDTFVSDKYASVLFKCKDSAFAPVRRSIRKQTKKNKYCNVIFRCNLENLKDKKMSGRGGKRASGGLGRDDLSSLVDQSDDAEDYLYADDLLWRFSADSPLLARLRNKKSAYSSGKFLRRTLKEDSSYSYGTPTLSTSSYSRYAVRYPGTVKSWDAISGSFQDADDEVDDQLDFPGRQGCGIPCYWSRRSTPKFKGGFGSCLSPSLSDTLRRGKGSKMLGLSDQMYKRSRRGSSLRYKKRKSTSRTTAQARLPLLTSHADGQLGSSIGTCNSDDELSTKFGELDMEALSRLDRKRWSVSNQSQDGLEVVAFNQEEESFVEEEEEEVSPETFQSLCQKYRPMFFEELVGQNIVVQSLMNAVSRKRIAPVYLFQGPHGTGKTSTSRVFAAALNCLVSEETKPCGICKECAELVSGKSRNLTEFDGTNKKAIAGLQYLLRSVLAGSSSSFSGYKIFVVNECHLLLTKTWISFLKFLEDPPPRVVFILITTDLDNVPHTVLSRCQKYLFNKIKDGDIVARLKKLASAENLDVDFEALNLIAVNADGSLQVAESMLDQLSLLGKTITASLVNELVGVVSDERLLELLELAMSSNTAETVRRSRELIDSGVDPVILMSQMATLIMDIITGSYSVDGKKKDPFFGRSLTEAELEILKRALKLLSVAEKQLRVSGEPSTWFTATLLQLGSVSSTDPTHSGSSRRQSSKTTEEEPSQYQRTGPQYAFPKSYSPTSFLNAVQRKSISKEVISPCVGNASVMCHPTENELRHGDVFASADVSRKTTSIHMNSKMLGDIWMRCVENCRAKALRQVLHTHGKLVSLHDNEGVFVAYVAFGNEEVKSQAERFHGSITNSFETVLRSNVKVRIILLPDGDTSTNGVKVDASANSVKRSNLTTVPNWEDTEIHHTKNGCSDLDSCQDARKVYRGSFNGSENQLGGNLESSEGWNTRICGAKDQTVEPLRRIESIIQEQRLETAWLQAMEKGTPGSSNHLRPERSQVLPQDGSYDYNQLESTKSMNMSSHLWEDGLIHKTKSLKIADGKALQKNKVNGKLDRYPMSPSLLHDSSLAGNFTKDNSGYESGSGKHGCSGFFCWRDSRSSNKFKGTVVRSHKGARFSLFGVCAKGPRRESRFKR